jgi:O-antigen/teichoic acid export membrane protein
MVIVGGLTLSDGSFGALLSTTENQAGRTTVAFLGLVASTIAAFALIPAFGLLGAAASVAVTRFVAFSTMATMAIKTLHVRPPMREVGRLLLCAAVATACALGTFWLAPGLVGNLIAGAVYAIVFSVLTMVSNCWLVQDVRLLQSVANRFPGIFGWTQPRISRWLERLGP